MCLSFLLDFNVTLIFSTYFFFSNLQIPNFIKICLVGAKMFHTDRKTNGWTDRFDEAHNRFSQFCARVYKNKKYTPTKNTKKWKFLTSSTLMKMAKNSSLRKRILPKDDLLRLEFIRHCLRYKNCCADCTDASLYTLLATEIRQHSNNTASTFFPGAITFHSMTS